MINKEMDNYTVVLLLHSFSFLEGYVDYRFLCIAHSCFA